MCSFRERQRWPAELRDASFAHLHDLLSAFERLHGALLKGTSWVIGGMFGSITPGCAVYTESRMKTLNVIIPS